MGNKAKIAEYGDFQTPEALALSVCAMLRKQGLRPASLLEPTCGLGTFLLAGLREFPDLKAAFGADVNAQYIQRAASVLLPRFGADRVNLVAADFFQTNWTQAIARLPQPVLVLGNLPWVTNAHLSTLNSQNIPEKSNFQNHNGLEAITGKANFDISEWMLIRLLEAMHGRHGTLAMLCKSSVARKVLTYAWKNAISIGRSAIHPIDAGLYFEAAVDAVLLTSHFAPDVCDSEAKVYRHFNDARPTSTIGFDDGHLLADIEAYRQGKHLCGEEVMKWRSGIKHDCSKIMELSHEGQRYRNGLGELVELEDDYLYPMLKSSHVANSAATNNRFMLVTQRTIGESTSRIQKDAPRTWEYLVAHAELLNKRGSSIYRNRPAFSIFGVGDYAFAPWKVAISGFYKRLGFRVIGPKQGKPVVLDDTSYFLPCQTKEQADLVAVLLNSPTAQSFYSAFVFWDAKRPITAELLRKLDLRRLSRELGLEDTFAVHLCTPDRELLLWRE
jgi:hypothetical protein